MTARVARPTTKTRSLRFWGRFMAGCFVGCATNCGPRPVACLRQDKVRANEPRENYVAAALWLPNGKSIGRLSAVILSFPQKLRFRMAGPKANRRGAQGGGRRALQGRPVMVEVERRK